VNTIRMTSITVATAAAARSRKLRACQASLKASSDKTCVAKARRCTGSTAWYRFQGRITSADHPVIDHPGMQ